MASEAVKTRSGSETRKRSTPVTSRYDDGELAELNERASRAGLTRASFQRVQALDTPPKTRSTRRAPIERQMVAKVLGQLGKIGSNMNQIAHSAHLGAADRLEIKVTVDEMRAVLPDIYQALGRR